MRKKNPREILSRQDREIKYPYGIEPLRAKPFLPDLKV